LPVDEVDERADSLIAEWSVRQIVVERSARIDHGDADARARVAEDLLHGARADRERRPIVGAARRTVVMNLEHRRVRRKLLQQTVGNIDYVSVDDVQLTAVRE